MEIKFNIAGAIIFLVIGLCAGIILAALML